jgi:hypothetical protein
MGKETIKFVRRHNNTPFYKLQSTNTIERQHSFLGRGNSMEGIVSDILCKIHNSSYSKLLVCFQADIDEKVSLKILKIARKQKERLAKANEDEEERMLIQKFPLEFDPDQDIDQKAHCADFDELGIDPSDEFIFEAYLTGAYKGENNPNDVSMDDDRNTIFDCQKKAGKSNQPINQLVKNSTPQ